MKILPSEFSPAVLPGEPVLAPAPSTSMRAAAAREWRAKRLRKHGIATDSDFMVVCPQCGDRFSVMNDWPNVDRALAKRHTTWLLDRFVWDHIQEIKHKGSIPLPLMKN